MAGERHGHGMEIVNQTRPHCVNQMGKTHSKPLAARHGRGTAWARHGNCESDTAALCKSSGKDTFYTLSGTAWQGNGMGAACYVWIGLKSLTTRCWFPTVVIQVMFSAPLSHYWNTLELFVVFVYVLNTGRSSKMLHAIPNSCFIPWLKRLCCHLLGSWVDA